MLIKKISVENFRCFKTYEVDLADQITVLIGKNGTGKTNLISAFKMGLSFIFSKNKIPGLKTLSTSGDLHVAKFETMDANFDDIERDFNYPLEIKMEANFYDSVIKWALVKNAQNGSLLTTRYKEAFEIVTNYYNRDLVNIELPIFAFFSDSYPHKKINVGSYAQSILAKEGPLPRNFGYYQWDAETNCAEIWQERYIKTYNVINDYKVSDYDIKSEIDLLKALINNRDELDENKVPEWEGRIDTLKAELEKLKTKPSDDNLLQEISYIDECIKSFTKPLRSDFNFINKEFEVKKIIVNRPKGNDFNIQFSFADGKRMFFNNLPQGYNRLLSIVFDIAYRSYILNGIKEPQGIVFIDEVELHLHPSLAQEVAQRLSKTFPKIQFVLSTHSPLVISNLKREGSKTKIIKLISDGIEFKNEEIENLYGADYITSLMEVMDAPYRLSTIDYLIDTYVLFKRKGKQGDAEKTLNELNGIVGNNNRFILKELEERLTV